MEGRPVRGRGGTWRRGGGRGGHDADGFGGEHRGRGRGGHHRGRGKRDHYRGRGRGGARPADFHHRDQDEGETFNHEDEERTEVFSRRKLESNWDRYKASEKVESTDDTPAQRGTDYHVLLGSAGDSFTQFRFSEEKDWGVDLFAASQISAEFVDLPALAQSLQEVPLHQRLNLEAELLQVSTPVELPVMTLAPKQETPKPATFTPPPTTLKPLCTDQKVPVASNPVSESGSRVSSSAAEVPANDDDDDDAELDQLLGLEKAVSGVSDDQRDGPEEVREDVAQEMIEEKAEVKDKQVPPPAPAPVKQEVTEEDLEDWLDSMIS